MTAKQSFFRDKHGNVVVWQMPNLPLWVWLVARVAQVPLGGTPAHVAGLIATGAILLWSVLEVASGASYFRRTLGAIVLLLTIWSLIK